MRAVSLRPVEPACRGAGPGTYQWRWVAGEQATREPFSP